MQFKTIFLEYKWRFSLTLLLILSEAGLSIMFPLFIGKAVDDAIHQSYQGAIQLGILGLLALMIGMGRRVYDSRLYARIFERLGVDMTAKTQNSNDSVKTARLHMLGEIVEFFENTLPELINQIIALVGIIFILALLNIQIFAGGIITFFLVFVIYVLNGPKTTRFNSAYNDELEKQVEVVALNNTPKLSHHLRQLMRWNIKLSDLEALNFSLSWLVLIAFLVVSIVLAVQSGVTQYGALFALVMYVFQLIENIVMLPLYYQHWLRLAEITQRLEKVEVDAH
ncbi:hypothetical protein BKI52_43040 [marine bacterium AO1-C]|nr:hypothetical protein BKI52_43040 [marine bacterium AO1-C]